MHLLRHTPPITTATHNAPSSQLMCCGSWQRSIRSSSMRSTQERWPTLPVCRLAPRPQCHSTLPSHANWLVAQTLRTMASHCPVCSLRLALGCSWPLPLRPWSMSSTCLQLCLPAAPNSFKTVPAINLRSMGPLGQLCLRACRASYFFCFLQLDIEIGSPSSHPIIIRDAKFLFDTGLKEPKGE